MLAQDALTVVKNPELYDAVGHWSRLSAGEQLAWECDDLKETINDAVGAAIDGVGFARLRLLDSAEGLSLESLQHLLVQLSQQVGFVLPQTHENNLLGLIRDEGKNYSLHTSRGHKTNSELGFHSDRSDLIFLLYVRPAKSGGDIKVVTFNDAAKHLERHNASAFRILFEDFPFDLRDESVFASQPWCLHPILWRLGSEIRGNYIRRFILDSQRHESCPRLTEQQLNALNEFESTLNRLGEDQTFPPSSGELVVLNNYKVLHARKGFTDGELEDSGRLAIRTWIAPYNSEPLPEFMMPVSGAVSPGCYRGGVGMGKKYLSMLGQTNTVNMFELSD